MIPFIQSMTIMHFIGLMLLVLVVLKSYEIIKNLPKIESLEIQHKELDNKFLKLEADMDRKIAKLYSTFVKLIENLVKKYEND